MHDIFGQELCVGDLVFMCDGVYEVLVVDHGLTLKACGIRYQHRTPISAHGSMVKLNNDQVEGYMSIDLMRAVRDA